MAKEKKKIKEPQSQAQRDQTLEGNLKPGWFYLHSGGVAALVDHVHEDVQPSNPDGEVMGRGVTYMQTEGQKERGGRGVGVGEKQRQR